MSEKKDKELKFVNVDLRAKEIEKNVADADKAQKTTVKKQDEKEIVNDKKNGEELNDQMYVLQTEIKQDEHLDKITILDTTLKATKTSMFIFLLVSTVLFVSLGLIISGLPWLSCAWGQCIIELNLYMTITIAMFFIGWFAVECITFVLVSIYICRTTRRGDYTLKS